jgi:hypothetical protein
VRKRESRPIKLKSRPAKLEPIEKLKSVPQFEVEFLVKHVDVRSASWSRSVGPPTHTLSIKKISTVIIERHSLRVGMRLPFSTHIIITK